MTTTDRVHRAMSADGTEVVGRVQGEGPPVVFISSAAGDGDSSWAGLVPFVADHITCFLLSTRGRGLSGDSNDHSLERLVEDITAFAEGIGEPVGLVGHSSGAMLALAAAAASTAVSAVAACEPGVEALMDDDTAARNQTAQDRATGAAADGRMADAARHFVEGSPFFNEEEAALLSDVGAFEFMAPFVPVWLLEMPEYLRAVDPSVIEQISAPVLLLHGARTHPWFTASVRHLADQLTDARAIEIPDVGHMAPVTNPEPVANELIRCFTSTPQRG